MATSVNSADDALRALTNKFEELTASIASRDAQREEEMSALTLRIADLNNLVVTEPKEQHSESRRSRRSRQKSRSRSSSSSSESPDLRPEINPDQTSHGHSHIEPQYMPSVYAMNQNIPAYMDPNLIETNLVPYTAADDNLRGLLDYRSYRLQRRHSQVSRRSSGRISEFANRVRSQTPARFSGIPAVGVLRFLRTLRIAFDDTGISEGIAIRLIPHFLEEPATTAFQRVLRIHGGSVTTYPQAIAWFLTTYASEIIVSAKQREISLISRQSGETVEAFSTRLQFEASLLGDLITERSLKTQFYAGLDAATSTFAQSVLPQGVVTQGFQEAVSHATRVDQSVSLLRPSSSPSQTNRFSQQNSRTVNPQSRGILAVPASYVSREENETEGQVDVDLGVIAISGKEPDEYISRRYYCFVCWKQGHFASECPLISEKDRKDIAARKAAVLGMMKNKPGWTDQSGRRIPNLPYQNMPSVTRSASPVSKNQ